MAIAAEIGKVLATIHRATFADQDCRDFFAQNGDRIPVGHPIHVVRRLERITPDVFGLVPADGLKFFALY